MNVLSLFSGIGGLELGLERAGMRVVGQVEINEYCRQVLARHWPEVPRHDDVRTAVEWWASEPRPHVDLVAGGFPCQGHSTAGRRRGTADERWGWPWLREVVSSIEPPLVLIENVPNLARTGLLVVLRDLADLGFDAWWGRVPAAAVGAPHLRWRLFVVAAHPERGPLRHEPGWGCRPDRTVVGHDGSTWALAHPERQPGRTRRPGDPEQGTRGRDADRGRVSEDLVADADGSGRHLRAGSQFFCGGLAEPAHGLGWAAEPDVGRGLDGFSAWLDRSGRLGEAHKLVLAYADAAGATPAEAVRAVRHSVRSEDRKRPAGGRGGLPPEEVLLALLRELAARCAVADAPLASEEASEAGVRGVRAAHEPPRPSLRRQPGEQRSGKPPDAVHTLSQLLARATEQAWAAYRRSNAGATGWDWEDGLARVAHGVPARVDRLRALGNAVVPAVAEHIGRLILAADPREVA